MMKHLEDMTDEEKKAFADDFYKNLDEIRKGTDLILKGERYEGDKKTHTK